MLAFDLLSKPVIERLRDLVEDYIRIQYYAARRIWKERNSPTPSGEYTWAEWFREMYGISLADYIEEAKAQGLKARVRAYEIEKFGSSSLEEE